MKSKESIKQIALFFIIVIALYFNVNNFYDFNSISIEDKNNSINKIENGNISVFFCSKDDCEYQLNNFILSADKFLYCAMYDIKLDSFFSAIIIQKNNGIDIKIIADDKRAESKNSKYNDLKQILNETIKTDEQRNTGKYNNLMHNKFCIKDNKSILTGSMNPTDNGVNKNANNLIVIDSVYLAQNYFDEFEEMQNNEFGDQNSNKVRNPIISLKNTNFGNVKIYNYFCPEDDCKNKIINEINKANNSIYFCLFSFTQKDTKNALINAANKGIKIYGIFDKTQAGQKYSVFNELKNQNNSLINIQKDDKPGFLHHKFFVIDNTTIITGSINPTSNGYFYNDENILIIENKKIAKMFLKEYEYQRQD